MRILPLILLYLSISVFPQANQPSLCARGLQSCAEKEVAQYSRFSERDLRNVIVEYDLDITRDLPTRLGEVKIQYLNNDELAQKYNSLTASERERGIPIIKIFPLIDKQDKLRFVYNNYWFKYLEKGGFFSQKKIYFSRSLEGGCIVTIGFDPERRTFAIEKVELWGV